MLIALLLIPVRGWAQLEAISGGERLTGNSPALIFRFDSYDYAGHDSYTGDYLNVNFFFKKKKGDGTYYWRSNIECDTIASMFKYNNRYNVWQEIADVTLDRNLTFGKNIRAKLLFCIIASSYDYFVYRYKYTALFAVVFPDMSDITDNLKIAEDNGMTFCWNVTNYKDRAASSEGPNAIKGFDSEVKLITDSNPAPAVKGLKWYMEPMLDMSAPESEIGRKIAMVEADESVTSINTNLDTYTLDANVGFKQIDLPKEVTRLSVMGTKSLGAYTSMSPIRISHIPEGWASSQLEVKPFIPIDRVKIDKVNKLGDEGENKSSYKLTWYLKQDPANDISNTDRFLVIRAHREDFSDATAVGNVDMKDGKKVGDEWEYTLEDTDEEAFYNASEYGANVYYRVVRAIVYAQWPDHRGKYCHTVSLPGDTYLPKVSNVSVDKTDGFEDTKTVKVRIELSKETATRKRTYELNEDTTIGGRTFVDLGLPSGTLWATTNVGAYSPEGAGNYYAWGETQSKSTYDWTTYKWRRPGGSTVKYINKYRSDLDGKLLLDFEDDAAVANWGSAWMMPTTAQFEELIDDYFTTITKTTLNGVNVRKITSLVNGNYIILPAVCLENYHEQFEGAYWTRSLAKEGDDSGQSILMQSGAVKIDHNFRYFGLPVRPVVSDQTNTIFSTWHPGANIVLERYSPEDEWYEGRDHAEKRIVVDGSNVMYDKEKGIYYVEIEDVQSAPYTHYYYSASVEQGSAPYIVNPQSRALSSSKADADKCYSESLAKIVSFTAQKGEGRGGTRLEWNIGKGDMDGYEIVRSRANYSNAGGTHNYTYSEKVELDLNGVTGTTYRDEQAYPGFIYQYTLRGYIDVRGKRYFTDPVTDNGYTKYYARIQGKILMDDGSAWPLSTKVKMRLGNDVNIVPALDKDHRLLAEAVDLSAGQVFFTDLKDDGTFEFDSIPYVANDKASTSYYVSTTADNMKNPTGMQGEFQIIFTPDTYEYTDITFITDNTRKVEGRIIYAGSTIPSRGIMFKVTDGDVTRTIVDRHGDPVVSDNNGNYSFSLPYRAQGYKVVAYKKGHKLKYDGVIQGNPGAKNVLCDIQDSTTVRLVGRLVGGMDQGDKPLGYGLSKNNLADKITMVLQLEGDNTSYITFNDQEPDNTTRSAQFTQKSRKQKLSDSGESAYEEDFECAPTDVSFERKRIVITPDNRTGEFCLDLAPTRYKITQMYGTGYSTFFAEGEGAAVIDLTNDSTIQTHSSTVDDMVYTTAYHHTYNRVYRTPVQVTYKQYVDGNETEYFGEKKLSVQSVYGKKIEPEAYKNGKYTFESPVYAQGGTYEMKVRAHEDYYFNNDRKSLPDIVGIRGGVLTVNNGFMVSNNRLVTALDSTGCASFWVGADNTSFNLVAKDALRELNMNVQQNGYYYEAKPLKAFVTGERSSEAGTEGTDILAMLADTAAIESPEIQLMDIIRDPYTSTGYAYRSRGTRYDMHREQKLDFGVDVGLTSDFGSKGLVSYGAWAGMGAGAYTGSTMGGSSTCSLTTTIPGLHLGGSWTGDYCVTLNERLQTSADPRDVGAMADVYVGIIPTYKLYHTEAFNVVDEETLRLLQNSTNSGRVKVVQESNDSTGTKYYLIIADKTGIREDAARTFAYSQKHILYNVVPELVRRLDEMVVKGTKDEVQALANKNNTFYYRITKENFNFLTGNDWYEVIRPAGNNKIKLDVPNQLINSIRAWLCLIQQNEQRKLKAIEGKGTLLKRYSLSDMEIDYSQDASYYYVQKFVGTALGIELKPGCMWKGIQLGLSGSKSFNFGQSTITDTKTQHLDYNQADNGFTGDVHIKIDLPSTTWSLKFTPKGSAEYSGSRTRLATNLAGSGFHMGVDNDAYLDVDVYTEPVDTAEVGDNSAYVWNESDWKWMSANGSKDYQKLQNHDYVFVVRGGAQRSPWMEPDSTIIEWPSKALGTKTLKIDNPKLYITNPVVNNLPKNERAVFSIRLTNETEYKGNTGKLKVCPMLLTVDRSSNPDGARLYIDGAPLGTEGLKMALQPGKSIVATLEVERGAKAYDYDDIRLILYDEAMSQYDFKTISVHYLPESTPVRISTPTDKWVMNTLSAQDDDGKYYLPVKIDGFYLDYDNFDHIEFQYKKQTEGDDAWTNLCSYYAKDDEYYRNATGTKKLLTSGSISDIRFYGEKDPMEMKYDLRAVSFSRLGTGYVTYASPVVSGIKDTRPPMLFGSPEPKEGILAYGDNLSMTFSEDIAYNYLDQTANFQVTGFTNTSASESQVYLEIDKAVSAHSLVEENFQGHDFSVDMMAKVYSHDNENYLMKIVSDESNATDLTFREKDNRLELHQDGSLIAQSAELPLDMTGALTHVGFTYSWDKKNVQFIVGDQVIENQHEGGNSIEISTHGHILLATQEGATYLNNLRVWNKELTPYEVANMNERDFTGNESNLVAYWPLTEGFGRVAKDLVGGNNLQITNPEWHTKEGKSLLLKNEPLVLKGLDVHKFTRYASDDYTLAFWYGNWQLNDQADSINIIHAGAPDLEDKGNFGFYFKKEDGKYMLKFRSEGRTFDVGQTDFSPLEWHHLAVSVSHSLGTANFFIDGELAGQAPASEIGGIAAATGITLGDKNLSGTFDELEFWELALPANYIQKNFNSQRMGDEMGLTVYMPFETMKRDGTIYNMEFSAKNHATYSKQGQGAVNVDAREPMFDVLRLTPAESADTTSAFIAAVDFEAPVHSSQGIESLPFTWTGTNTQLQINLKKDDYDINGRYVNITVRGVEDLAGNPMANPVMWTVFVHRNVLFFGDKNISVTTDYGKRQTVATTLRNDCGKNLSFTIEPNCSWLTPSITYGQLEPLEEKNIEFEVSDGLSPGNYVTKVTLTDQNGLTSSLNVTVTVTIEEPDWNIANDRLYTRTMNLMATVYEQSAHSSVWLIDNDPNDIVAAFIDNVCVGKTHLTVDRTSGTSYLYMTIRGKEGVIGHDVVFRLWDASTGNIYCLSRGKVTDGKWVSEKTQFASDAIIGGDSPVEMRTTSSRTQYINLAEGWNWISFNISAEGGADIFMNTDQFTKDDMFTCAGRTSIYKGDNIWTPLTGFAPTRNNVFEVYVHNPIKLSVNGTEFADEDLSVDLNFNGNAWAELAYLLDETLPVNVALVDFPVGDKAPVGTMIKSYDEFAIARADGKWIGSLQYMRPGAGYFVKCNDDRTTKTIRYFRQSAAKSSTAAKARNAASMPQSVRTHSAMMPVIATFKDGDVEEGDILVAYAGGEVVGVAQPGAAVSGEEDVEYSDLFFIPVNASDGDWIQFVKYRDGEAVAATKKGVRCIATGIVGTLEDPYLIDFSDASADDIYDITGLKYDKLPSKNGIYIIGDKKVLMRK